jgi:serine/threonine protein kinase
LNDPRLERLLATYVHAHVEQGRRLDPAELCRDAPELTEPLADCIRRYHRLQETLAAPARTRDEADPAEPTLELDGFRTIERLGGGGGGEVYKLEDLELGRMVAAKRLRPRGALRQDVESFLREARSMALFDDPRIATVYEFRGSVDPPVLLMEYVEGFELGRIGRSLEYPQRARIVAAVAEAIDNAHRRGIQHRDLKPSNIMLDARLEPRILDFGLSRGDPDLGHGMGTPSYMAPEQLDPRRPIDARTDVYALGVILYELICGALPFEGRTTDELLAAIREAAPRLPVEIEPGAPEPLQAIALKAMERDPADRYTTARDMVQDLRRYLAGRPVTARPTLYQSALARRMQPHLEQIREWLRIKLIHPHEERRLRETYDALQAREDDWIVRSRSLALSQIALYLGAFLAVAGSLLYFQAYFLESVPAWLAPLLVLGLPFAGLSFAATRLFRRGREAVAVAFHLAAVLLLPLLLVVLFDQLGLWPAAADDPRELVGEGYTSNRQLQVAALIATLWAGRLALGTRTVTLSASFTLLLFALHLSLLADFGLREWLENFELHRLSLHLAPLLVVLGLFGSLAERRQSSWLARPLYYAAAGLLVLVLELLALDGKLFHYLALSMAPFQGPDVSDPLLLDTMTAMTLNGLAIYAVAWLLEQRGTPLLQRTSWLLYLISPFAILYPFSHLVGTGEYSLRYDWLYLALSLAITLSSHFRQRKSFYYAGLLNTGIALWFVTDHHDWFDRPAWAIAVLLTGLAVLGAGLLLHLRERRGPGNP